MISIEVTVMDINELNLGLKFGKKEIARNGNVFFRSLPSEEFWTYYKEHKEELKENGYSVYKLNGTFYVYDWTSTEKHTYEEYLAEQERIRNQWLERAIKYYLLSVEDMDAERHGITINYKMTTLEELTSDIEQNMENPDVWWEAIRINVGSVDDIDYDEE